MTTIYSQVSAKEWMRIWEDRTDGNICDEIEGLILDGNGDFLEPPSYTWDDNLEEVVPGLEMVKPKAQQLNLWICNDSGTTKAIEIKFSECGSPRPTSRVYDVAKGSSEIPEVVAADIIRSFIDFHLAVQERVDKFNAARRRAYDTATIEVTIEKILNSKLKASQALPGPRSRRNAIPRTPAIKSEEGIYSAVVPFFKADQQVMGAAEKAINTFNAIGSPYDSVETVMQELEQAIKGHRKANAGPAAKLKRH
ncbi:hypothetical protein IWX49DRAFT_590929 [Phyllosticta citricarpa]|uniref:Uncharacterized protein n=2 Tax=Phyllosticta TaxID=121621 RepID=A0ABR1LY26_9PEZI